MLRSPRPRARSGVINGHTALLNPLFHKPPAALRPQSRPRSQPAKVVALGRRQVRMPLPEPLAINSAIRDHLRPRHDPRQVPEARSANTAHTTLRDASASEGLEERAVLKRSFRHRV
eukprot:3305011-Rhodomonas_salina.3